MDMLIKLGIGLFIFLLVISVVESRQGGDSFSWDEATMAAWKRLHENDMPRQGMLVKPTQAADGSNVAFVEMGHHFSGVLVRPKKAEAELSSENFPPVGAATGLTP